MTSRWGDFIFKVGPVYRQLASAQISFGNYLLQFAVQREEIRSLFLFDSDQTSPFPSTTHPSTQRCTHSHFQCIWGSGSAKESTQIHYLVDKQKTGWLERTFSDGEVATGASLQGNHTWKHRWRVVIADFVRGEVPLLLSCSCTGK